MAKKRQLKKRPYGRSNRADRERSLRQSEDEINQAKFKAEVERLEREYQPYFDATRRCERLTAADYAIVINARAGD